MGRSAGEKIASLLIKTKNCQAKGCQELLGLLKMKRRHRWQRIRSSAQNVPAGKNASYFCSVKLPSTADWKICNPLVSAVNKFFSARDYPQKGPLKRKGVSCTTGTLDTNSWKAYAVMATMARRPFLTSASAMKLVRPFGSMPAMGVENPLRFRGSKP
ncbi:unnamed protein product [Polarella glacialis]|uniref:Uncharacterized protein n=1 Tax=Polarella glacialis TaxID=89957 RepID=A0A813DYX8_POLGL|nr:unnamed protein product [Polarella glacialis]